MVEITDEQVKQMVRAARLLEEWLDPSLQYEGEVDLSGDTGTNTKDWDRVESRGILVITNMVAYDNTSSATWIEIGYYNGRRRVPLKRVPAPLIGESVEFSGQTVLREQMYPYVKWYGVTSGDDLYAFVSGFRIRT